MTITASNCEERDMDLIRYTGIREKGGFTRRWEAKGAIDVHYFTVISNNNKFDYFAAIDLAVEEPQRWNGGLRRCPPHIAVLNKNAGICVCPVDVVGHLFSSESRMSVKLIQVRGPRSGN